MYYNIALGLADLACVIIPCQHFYSAAFPKVSRHFCPLVSGYYQSDSTDVTSNGGIAGGFGQVIPKHDRNGGRYGRRLGLPSAVRPRVNIIIK